MIVNVEQRHIDQGRKGERCLCPIALAIKETAKKLANEEDPEYEPMVEVDEEYVIINGHDAFLPKEARHFVMDYDSDKEVKPFTFELLDPTNDHSNDPSDLFD